jgi:hypothetical protein
MPVAAPHLSEEQVKYIFITVENSACFSCTPRPNIGVSQEKP